MTTTITLSIPAQIAHCQDFDFCSNNKFNSKRKTKFTSLDQKLRQDVVIGQIEAFMHQFEVMPVDGTFSISVHEGVVQDDGGLRPFNLSSQHRTEMITQKIKELASTFSSDFPNSSFTVSFSQSITVTDVC
jgi:hypothetical protein